MRKEKIVKKFKMDGETIIFRYPTIKDLNGLLNHINSLIEERAKISLQKKKSKKEEKEWLLESLKNIKEKSEVFLVVDWEEKIMGSCRANKKDGSRAHVAEFGISLNKEIRGKGIGTLLLKTLIKETEKVFKIKIAVLDVFSSNTIAQGLYKKLGFKEVGRIKKGVNYYGKYQDWIIMAKYL